MPTTIGTKTKVSEVRKRAEKLDMERLTILARETNEDGTYLSHQEIADKMGCKRVTVTRALQRIPKWMLVDKTVEEFRQGRADNFAEAQQLIFRYITPEKLKDASLQQLGTLLGIMYDKERLERGQATQHIANVSIASLDKETRKLLQEAIKTRTKSLVEAED